MQIKAIVLGFCGIIIVSLGACLWCLSDESNAMLVDIVLVVSCAAISLLACKVLISYVESPESRRTLVPLILGFELLIGGGCTSATDTVNVSLKMSVADGPKDELVVPLRISTKDGKVSTFHTFQWKQGATVTLKHGTPFENMQVELLAPNGWFKPRFDMSADGKDLDIFQTGTFCLCIDNRDHGAVRVECGELPGIDVAAGATLRRFFFNNRYSSQTDAEVKLDGVVVGKMYLHTLIDVVGTRRYRETGHVYSTNSSEGDSGSSRDLEPGEKVRSLGESIDYFLSPAPSALSVQYDGSRQELYRTDLIQIFE